MIAATLTLSCVAIAACLGQLYYLRRFRRPVCPRHQVRLRITGPGGILVDATSDDLFTIAVFGSPVAGDWFQLYPGDGLGDPAAGPVVEIAPIQRTSLRPPR